MQGHREQPTSGAHSLAGRVLRVRWFVRAPIWLFRARLGFLFGSRLLLLEHVGRRSGLRRYVVLEVVARPRPGRYIVVSGLGPSSQWFQNVLAEPRVRVSVGSKHLAPAQARQLPIAEARAVLGRYAAKYPRAWHVLEPALEESVEDDGGEVPAVPAVELSLEEIEERPRPQD